jgi:hypothetical protein
MTDADRAFESLRRSIGLGRVTYCLSVANALIGLGDIRSADAWLDKAEEHAMNYAVAWWSKP